MGLAEIKQEIDALNHSDRAELLRYLRETWQRDDPEWRAEIDRRLEEVRNGDYLTGQELEERRTSRMAEGS